MPPRVVRIGDISSIRENTQASKLQLCCFPVLLSLFPGGIFLAGGFLYLFNSDQRSFSSRLGVGIPLIAMSTVFLFAGVALGIKEVSRQNARNNARNHNRFFTPDIEAILDNNIDNIVNPENIQLSQ